MKKTGPQWTLVLGFYQTRIFRTHDTCHRVAIDMSEMLIPRTQNPSLINLSSNY